MKAELKEVIGYIPHGLKYLHNGQIFSVVGISQTSETNPTYRLICDPEDAPIRYNYRAPLIEEVDFILHPMSDLENKITHRGYNNGEPFVPLIELAKVCLLQLGGDIGGVEFDLRTDFVDTIHPGSYNKHQFYITVDNGEFVLDSCLIENRVYINQVELFSLLDQWFFDYRGLIPQGKAKSVHDLKSNPYE